MLKRISRWVDALLFTAPRPVDGPFASAAAEVADMERKDRDRWEEREAHWRAKSVAILGPKAWNTDPGVPAQHFGRKNNNNA